MSSDVMKSTAPDDLDGKIIKFYSELDAGLSVDARVTKYLSYRMIHT